MYSRVGKTTNPKLSAGAKGNAKQTRRRYQYSAILARKWMLRHQPREMARIEDVARKRYPLSPSAK